MNWREREIFWLMRWPSSRKSPTGISIRCRGEEGLPDVDVVPAMRVSFGGCLEFPPPILGVLACVAVVVFE